MGAPHKFLFEQSFDLPDAKRAPMRKAPPPPPPPEPTFSAAELEAARAAGIAAGTAAGRAAALAEATQSIEARVAGAISGMALGIKVLLASRDRYAEEAQHAALKMLRAVLAKTLPALCRKMPLLEIEGVIGQCLREAFDEPRLVVRVADGIFETMQQRIGAIAEAAGFSGKMVLLADDTLAAEDVRVEWAEGGAERETRRLIDDIDGALARALDSIPIPGTSPPQENAHE
jgi:flagellar assembly protein FliH